MFCSAIIPTIGRSTLARAVMSVLDQDFHDAEFEIIVVNDSAQPLPAAPWQHSPRVRTVVTQKRERSVARNTGAALARGRYLYFLDDDDVMLPGALAAFWAMASREPDAGWLYGSYRTVDNDGRAVGEFHPELAGNISGWLVAGEAIPLQASFFRAEAFYDAGEFDVYFTGAQDRDLERRLSLRWRAVPTAALVAEIRVGRDRSTTDWSRLREFDRWGREKLLDQPNAFHALWESGSRDAHLHGRICRAYAASAVWRLRRKDLLRGADRLMRGGLFAIPYVLSPSFWEGARECIPPLGNFESR